MLTGCGGKTDAPVEEETKQEPVEKSEVKDPATYGSRSPDYQGNGYPYYVKVNILANTVTVYEKDAQENYTVPCRAMVCSTGTYTPTSGVYRLSGQGQWKWLSLQQDVYGQYCTQITGNILFHSVPYMKYGDKSSLEYQEFDKLGTSCSLGCVRLQVEDAKWIYENKESIYAVEFYGSPDPGPLGKPVAPIISDNVKCRGWDPTDPDGGNPWNGGSGVPEETFHAATPGKSAPKRTEKTEPEKTVPTDPVKPEKTEPVTPVSPDPAERAPDPAPVQPVDPEPVEPVDPVDPEPEEPTEPQPEEPVEPEEPTEPESGEDEPVEPEAPVDGTDNEME